MTPSLVHETVILYQQDPELVKLFGSGLYELAQQGIISLREVLLGALQFEHPRLLGTELRWLQRLLEAREVNSETLYKSLAHIRERLAQDLPAHYSAKVVETFDRAVSQLEPV